MSVHAAVAWAGEADDRRSLARTLALCGVFVVVAACAWLCRWPTTERLVRYVDPGGACVDRGVAIPLCDFSRHFYPQGRRVLVQPTPVRGYFYSPSFALALSLVARLDLETARAVWALGSLLAALAFLVLAVGGLFLPARAGALLFTALLATSFPLLHCYMWGQVSVLVAALSLGALLLAGRSRSVPAGVLLAAAVCVKYYPVVFVSYLFVRRDRRALLSFLVALTVLGGFAPGLLLGVTSTVAFYESSHRATLGLLGELASSPYPQYWPNVIDRHLTGSIEPASALYRGLRASGYLIALANLALLAALVRRSAEHEEFWAFSLLSTALPFVLGTSWVHYFVHLPLVHAFAWLVLRRAGLPPPVAVSLGVLFLVPSALLGSVAWFDLVGSPEAYYQAGWLCVANALVLVPLYAAAWPSLGRAGTRTEGPCWRSRGPYGTLVADAGAQVPGDSPRR